MASKMAKITNDPDMIIQLKQDINAKFGIPVYDIHLVGYVDGSVEIEAGDGDIYGYDEGEVNEFIRTWINEAIS